MKHNHFFTLLFISILLNPLLASSSSNQPNTIPNSTQNNLQGKEDSQSESIFPLITKEIIGIILIIVIAGLASTGGMGGGPLLTSILIIFFYYTINQAIAVVYGLVFAGSLGNFINVVGRRDPKTNKPLVNYDLALLCMPTMILGANIGVIFGRMAAPIVIILGIVALTAFNLARVFKKAKKQFREESQDRETQNIPLAHFNNSVSFERFSEIAGDQGEFDPELADILKKEHKLFPKSKYGVLLGLLLSVMILSLLRGSQNFDSIIDVEYCRVGYWGIHAVTLCLCLCIFFFNKTLLKKNIQIKQEHNNDSQAELYHEDFELNDTNLRKLTSLSAIAGILAGLLGIGGGMLMNPTLLGMGVTPQTTAATLGFFVVQTSFISLFQSLLYGDVPFKEQGFFFLVALVGAFSVSMLLSWVIKKTKRTSIVLFILLGMLILTLIVTPVFEVWQNVDNLKKLVEFQPLC